jgi:threonine synthase
MGRGELLPKDERRLASTLSGEEFPFDQLAEFTAAGESLEVVVPGIEAAQVRSGKHLWERFAEFLPFEKPNANVSLGEGNTPLLLANARLRELMGIPNLLLKDETQNPTYSFKDRGSLTCLWMAEDMGEDATATISTGNMGNSIAAYAARAGKRAIVFIPHFAPEQKVQAIGMHGATIIRITAPDYAAMKNAVLDLAEEFKLRIVSGNGPIRVEGYKLIAFEMWEQMEGEAPDFIAVPTSACGHIRGIWKGWSELERAGLVSRLPRMIIVQAANNSPLVTAWKRGEKHVVPFSNFHTIAEAITSGNPLGADEILEKAYRLDWLAKEVTEEEILDGQREFARAGHFVEPATATTLHAVRKLQVSGKIQLDAKVVLMLTGAGLKDLDVMPLHKLEAHETTMGEVRTTLQEVMK